MIFAIVWHNVLVVLVIIRVYGACTFVVAIGIVMITSMAIEIFIPAWVAIMASDVILLLFFMALAVVMNWEVRDSSVGQEFCDGDIIVIEEFSDTDIVVFQEFANGVV